MALNYLFQSGYDQEEESRKEIENEAKRVKVCILKSTTGDDFTQFCKCLISDKRIVFVSHTGQSWVSSL